MERNELMAEYAVEEFLKQDTPNVGIKYNIRVRYGKSPAGARQSALVTVKEGDLIFFGISKCHPKKDKFNKAMALEIAFGRAQKAMKEYKKNSETINDYLPIYKLMGAADVTDAVRIVEYFRALNEIMQ